MSRIRLLVPRIALAALLSIATIPVAGVGVTAQARGDGTADAGCDGLASMYPQRWADGPVCRGVINF